MENEDQSARLTNIEAHLRALEWWAVHLTALVPASHVLMDHLPENAETHLLYSQEPEGTAAAVSQHLARMLAMLRGLRRDIALRDIELIDQAKT